MGNLTNVVYPVSPSIVLAYDPLNRLTTMVDGLGTTAYGLPHEMAAEVDSIVKSIKIAALDGTMRVLRLISRGERRRGSAFVTLRRDKPIIERGWPMAQ